MEKIPENLKSESRGNLPFDSQFDHRERFETAGGNSEVLDIIPEHLKDETPVFLAPAWGLEMDVYKGSIKTLSEQERRVISLSHPRRGGDMKARISAETREGYPEEELRKALNILDVIERKNVEQVDIIAHSEGAINATIAAMLHPEKFRNIVYFAPAGLIGKDNFSRLIKGFAGQTKRATSLEDYPVSDAEKKTAEAALFSLKKYLLANPLRALREVVEISKSQIHDMIRYLHDEKGIGIIVMAPMDDPVFPMEKMAEYAKMDSMDLFAVTLGGHGGIGDQPERFMAEAEEMLSALQYQTEHAVEGVKPDITDYFKTIGYS